MKTKLHLISMPWAQPHCPSTAVGALKAYVEKVFGDQVEVNTYSGHLAIYASILQSYFFMQDELPFALLIYKKFILPHLKKEDRYSIVDLLEPLAQQNLLNEEFLRLLEDATNDYLDSFLIPSLINDGINVVGFTLTHCQIASSLYVQRYISEKSSASTLFLYGGKGASSPHGVLTLQKMKAEGYRVLGEGEQKLELLLKNLLSKPDETPIANIKFFVDGIVPVGRSVNISGDSVEISSKQIPSLNVLPVADYGEYFQSWQKLNDKRQLSFTPIIPVEGSRGCFASCDFCGLNAQWKGFRKLSADEIFKRVIDQVDRYKTKHIIFVDTVCDLWAERFADLILKSEKKITFFMELRANHPERFWTKLAMAGLTEVQVGIEALSNPLLKEIGKGTSAIQNLLTQKYLRELGVDSTSNLLTLHPKSTVSDIQETKRILKLTPHFPRLNLSPIYLDSASRLLESVDPEELQMVDNVVSYNFPPNIEAKISLGFRYVTPGSLQLKKSLRTAWENFSDWYSKSSMPHAAASSLSVKNLDENSSLIEDCRWGEAGHFILRGPKHVVVETCHSGATLSRLKNLSLGDAELSRTLTELESNGFILKTGDHYISLALRDKAKLIERIACKSPIQEFKRSGLELQEQVL